MLLQTLMATGIPAKYEVANQILGFGYNLSEIASEFSFQDITIPCGKANYF